MSEIILDLEGTFKVPHTCQVCGTFTSTNLEELKNHLTQSHLFGGNSISEYCYAYKNSLKFAAEKQQNKKKVKRWGTLFVRRSLANREILCRREEDLSENEKLIIPENNDFIFCNKEHKHLISVLNARNSFSCLITGDKGLGKTEAVLNIASKMRMPVLRFNMSGKTIPRNFLVDQEFDGKELKWVDRSLVICIRNGYWWLCDEISACNPIVAFSFFMLLEKATIHLENGEILKAHPRFKIIFTDNRIGNSHNSYKYQGTFEQNISFLDRIQSVIQFKDTNYEDLKRILISKFPKIDLLYNPISYKKDYFNSLVELKKLTDEEFIRGGITEKISIRSLINILNNFEIVENMLVAIEIGFLSKINQQDAEFILDLAKRFF